MQPEQEIINKKNDTESHSEYVEDSDDSIKDKTYQCDPDDITTSEDENETSSEEELQHTASNEENVECNTSVYKGRPKKGRKWKYEGQDRKIRKKKTNSNEAYYSSRGKLKGPKPFTDFHCTCQSECHTKISVDDRNEFFSHYWSLADYNVQTAYISTCVRERGVKRKVVNAREPEKRKFSRTYTIKGVSVCREMFIRTLGLSTKRINTSLHKVRNLSVPDRRGVAGGHNKMSEELRKSVIDHINKFPRYKSHYCRATRNEQEFLPLGMTVTLMYKLYKDENENSVSLSSYRKIFLTEFNLKTKTLQKDTCNKCDLHQAKLQNSLTLEAKEEVTREHNLHLEDAEKARNLMKHDLSYAADNEDTDTITFDMEKTLPLPRLTTNIIFYKRQLWLYNCGIYSGKDKKSVFNVWIEGRAGRGAQEVGSCLRKYIETNVGNTVRKLILWSDSCGGQNRNIKMVLLLKCILEESNFLESIQLRFLVSGHSYLPNDSDFGDVECALKKHQKLYSPEDYINIMKGCRKKNPITVNLMTKEDFVSTKKLENKITNRKKDNNQEKINWLHMREIKVVKEKPYSIFFLTRFDDAHCYQEVNIKKGKGKKQEAGNFTENLEVLWPEGKPVAQAKLDDIKSYLHLIPEVDHQFYTDLIGEPDVQEDIEGYNGQLDFEIEVTE